MRFTREKEGCPCHQESPPPTFQIHPCRSFKAVNVVLFYVLQVSLKKQEDAWFASLGDKNVHTLERPPYNMPALTSASVFLVVCYIIGVIEGWMSGTRTYVSDINKLSDFRQEHKTIRGKVPIVMLEARAYHYANQKRVWKNGVMVCH